LQQGFREEGVMQIQNAKVTGTMFGIEDHGILTASIFVDYGGSGQGIGGYSLEEEYAARWLRGVLKVLDIDRWEYVKGQLCRVKREDGWNGKVLGIGHIIEDRWFMFDSMTVEPKEEADVED
jgi:hypothetical protein